jgi:amyloid beta precursor protein binding protein 1
VALRVEWDVCVCLCRPCDVCDVCLCVSLPTHHPQGEENYDEAVEFAHRAYLPPSLDADTQRVFEDQRGQEASLDDKSELFWICVAATNRFRASEGQGLYPASASLPDMTSDTKYFVALGELFKAKAKQDCAAVLAHANALVASLSWEQSTQQQVAEYVAYFVKHVRWLRVVGTSSLAQEYAPETFNATAATEYFEEVDYEAPPDAPAKPNMIHWYMAFRAAFSFSQHYGRWPGAAAEHVDADAKQLAETAHELITAASVESGAVDARVMTEFTRYGGKEMHTTASAVGGIASQVVLKVLLSQFVPVNSTIMYNGIHAQCAMLEL